MSILFGFIKRIVLVFLLFSISQVIILKFVPVYVTPLMVIHNCERLFSGEKIRWKHHWVSGKNISNYLPQAVIASEDNLFTTHKGFDLEQIEKAQKDAKKGKRLRGASTISQQTAKNVFLWPGRSYVRKGLEAYYTLLIELIWGKQRIMEVYLNSIEMGNGIYGAEAVARAHFNKTAKNLTRNECALIAATLPNPIKFNSAKPSNYLIRRQSQIIYLMPRINSIDWYD